MKKKHKLKLKKEVKNGLLIGACIIALIIAYNKIISKQDEAVRQRVEDYRVCIIKQSQTRGWIIRSECSSDWRVLDEMSGLKYKTIGYDVYLKEGGR